MSCYNREGHAYSHWNLWPYLVMRGLLTTPRDVTWPQILMLYNQEVWKPLWKNLGLHLLQESLPDCFSKFLCVSEVSLRVKLINLLRVHCFSYQNSALHQLIFVFSNHRTTINLHILPPRICVGSLEYQFLSVQHEPETASLWNQPLGHHRRSWHRTSYSGYNNVHAG